MQSTHFTIQGFTRTYWDFLIGAGFTVGVLDLFAAVLAWQLGGLPEKTLALMRVTAWGQSGLSVSDGAEGIPSSVTATAGCRFGHACGAG